MPRSNAPRSITARGEANLARRIEFQREKHGWSYETLAKHMRAAGCPIQASALFRIEKGDPPRKITVDELVALAEVFGVDDVNLMLRPMQDVLAEEALRLREQIKAASQAVAEGGRALLDLSRRLYRLHVGAEAGDAADEYVQHHIHALNAQDLRLLTDELVRLRESLPASEQAERDPFVDLYGGFLEAIADLAQKTFDEEGDRGKHREEA